MKNKLLFLSLWFVVVCVFFRQFLFYSKLPIPADTIIGLYHPFRDLYAKNYPNGISFKNFLITDPVRQQLPWRYLSISLEKKLQLPVWNPYNFSGTPLLGNFQSGSFYPLNILFFFFSFSLAWSILIFLEALLGGFFLFLYLRYKNLNEWACFLGSIVFSFCGFSIAWMEWNTLLHVVIWLPLILLAKEHLLKNRVWKWIIILIFAECSQIFAGHLQILFYSLIISNTYLLGRIIQNSQKNRKSLLKSILNEYIPFFGIGATVLIITVVEWLPTFRFIFYSARLVDQYDWMKDGWFLPWHHLVQFIVPDFFGNPTTLNYWGVWNYAELIGYVGLIPLCMSLYALLFRKDKKTLFFGTLFFVSLLFSLPTFFAKLPFVFRIPFISSAQPTRLLYIVDFSLSVLSALGIDYLMKEKRKIFYPVGFIGVILTGLWIVVLNPKLAIFLSSDNLDVARRNLVLPTMLLLLFVIFCAIYLFTISKKIEKIIIGVFLCISVFDLFRFGEKFIPFTNENYLFPVTRTTQFLSQNQGNFRYMTTDSRILPPNFSIMYSLQSIDGYDPLYLQRYGELIAALERGKPNISSPFGFNRIITPHKYDSKIIDLLGVKYILTLSDINTSKLIKVFQEGETRVYENSNVLPRAFFVSKLNRVHLKEQVVKRMFETDFNPREEAIVEDSITWHSKSKTIGDVKIITYTENKISIETKNPEAGFLVHTDSYYPTWRAKIDNISTKIYRTDYNFRGVIIPAGKHTIIFYTELF